MDNLGPIHAMDSTQFEKHRLVSEAPMEESNVEPDAVHPRFQPRTHLLFKCPECGATKPEEARMKRHFLKKECFPIHSACTECGGPVFYYLFGPRETRLAHDCNKWAQFQQKKGPKAGQSDASSLAGSTTTQSTDSELKK